MQTEETKIEPYYQNEAKRFVDALFDNNLFREDITRTGIQGVEDLLAFYLQSYAKTANRIADWGAKFEKSGIREK